MDRRWRSRDVASRGREQARSSAPFPSLSVERPHAASPAPTAPTGTTGRRAAIARRSPPPLTMSTRRLQSWAPLPSESGPLVAEDEWRSSDRRHLDPPLHPYLSFSVVVNSPHLWPKRRITRPPEGWP